MPIQYTMQAGRDNDGRPIRAEVEEYVCVATRVRDREGVVFNILAAVTHKENFSDDERRLMLYLMGLLGQRKSKAQFTRRRVSMKKVGEAIGCNEKTAKVWLVKLARRNIIRLYELKRDDMNRTHEVAWNLNFGDWIGIQYQGKEVDENAA